MCIQELLNPWSSLEELPSPASATVWRSYWGESFAAFQQAFLQRSPLAAASVPCPNGCGCAHEVIQHSPQDIIGVCRCEPRVCDDLRLGPEELMLWSLSWPKLGRALCQAFAFQPRPTELNLANTKQLGAWSINMVPAILSLAGDSTELRFAIGQLAARLRQPFILLAPTLLSLDVLGKELLANAGAACFDLASNVQLTAHGGLLPLRAPGELFARFNPAPAESHGETVARQAFALVKGFETSRAARKASPAAVFRYYCIEGLNAAEVARRCHCTRSLVFERLAQLQRKLGRHPRAFRQYSAHLEQIENSLSDSRARRVYRKGALYGDEGEQEE